MRLPVMSANPHLYDYLHCLRFQDDFSVELLDGAGQVINMVTRGSYRARERYTSRLEVSFHDLVEVNPYDDYQKVREIAGFAVRCTLEHGTFPFRRQVMWGIDDEQEWPCMLFRERYVFDRDPLSVGQANQARNLYYRAEPEAYLARIRDSARYYYPRDGRQEHTWRELAALGITQEALLDDSSHPSDDP